jgi:pullulanase
LEGFEFAYADNHYTLTAVVLAGSHEFKIADPDWADVSTLGGLEGQGDVALDEAQTLTLPGDENLKLTLEEDTLLSFDVDATNKSAPVMTVSKHVPFQGRTMYLKGTMNSWGGDLAGYEFTATAAAIYTLDVTLPAASYEFKIADTDWQDDSTMGGVSGNGALVLDTAVTLTLPGDENLTLDIAEEKVYTFTVDASHPAMPVLTVVEK